MALVRKGSRRISVDDTAYRWRVRRRATYSQGLGESPMTFAAELADGPGRVLVVATRHPRPDNCFRRGAAVPVTPAVVASAIRQAREEGWSPSSPGSPHHLTL
ncbi:hypothetical protein ACFWTE_26365 [Nocardiopsis sp. NPDC058631]|uniref:hypothetical protein n=1 Tax=Nocardiopsis sp. NPDC058631 TaxID=3346566 RepID=UPI0036568A53